YLADQFQKEQAVDLRRDETALRRLQEAEVRARKALASAAETEISLPFIAVGAHGPMHLAMKLTRVTLQALTGDATATEETTGFSWILAQIGDRKIQVINELKGLTGLRLAEVKTLAESVPALIKQNVGRDEAMRIKAALEHEGATVEIRAARARRS